MEDLSNVGQTQILPCDTCYGNTEHSVSEGVYIGKENGISESYICSKCKNETVMMFRYVVKPTLGRK